MTNSVTIILLLFSFALYSCHSVEDRVQDITPYSYSKPVALNDDIMTTTTDSLGITTSRLADLINDIRQQKIIGIDSLLIAKDGELVLEEYFAGWKRDDMHDLRSATKSITSLLAGIAIDQQLLQLDMAVYPHFSTYYPTTDNWSPDKSDITLQDVMNMSSGLACNDGFDSSPGNESRMYRHRDWVKFILDLPMVRRPSVWFSYCTGGVQLVARMIENTSGLSLDEFTRSNLFNAMGIDQFLWTETGTGREEGSGHIYMRSRDMLKLGFLVMNNGQWNGQQLVSNDWINQLHNPFYEFYGNFWWHRSFEPEDASYPDTNAIYASGNGGQQIWVFPDLALVVVFTANNYNERIVSFDALHNYILPAVNGS